MGKAITEIAPTTTRMALPTRVRLAKPGTCYAYRTVALLTHGVAEGDENGTSPKHIEFAGLKGISQLMAAQASNHSTAYGWESGGMICVTPPLREMVPNKQTSPTIGHSKRI